MKFIDEKLIEAVPNVSAGADPEAVSQLVSAAASGGALVAHVDTSISANRTVITLLGNSDQVVASCCALVATAADVIDMRTHTGTHPCVGAVDVAPFIPLGTATMEDAIACAERLACWAAKTYSLPCFLYGAAARKIEHQTLPELRRGGIACLSARLEQHALTPDYGSSPLHPKLGALITGARDILIAYNIQLSTSDVRAASKIAAAIRTTGPSGRPHALPYLRAIGWYEEAHRCAEVSCNLLDYSATSLWAVWDAVSTAAKSVGCEAVSSDIIGLAPESALEAPGISQEEYLRHIKLGVCRSFEVEKRTIEPWIRHIVR